MATQHAPVPRRRKNRRIPSPAAQSARANLSFAARLFGMLTDDERQQWRDYAAANPTPDARTGAARPRQADNVFVGLLCRFMQANPSSRQYPRTPPPFLFAGDPLHVTAQATPGGVVFTSTGPTSAHVRVELLLQRLPSPARVPQPGRYRTQKFASFTPDALTMDVPMMRGWYVPAYRFVNTQTGQDTPLFVLPKVTVGEAPPSPR